MQNAKIKMMVSLRDDFYAVPPHHSFTFYSLIFALVFDPPLPQGASGGPQAHPAVFSHRDHRELREGIFLGVLCGLCGFCLPKFSVFSLTYAIYFPRGV
jgi:hypothetical protein